MEQALFNILGRLEMRSERERMNEVPEWERIDAMAMEAAKFVSMLAIAKHAQNIVEIGSGVGYSTLWLAYAASKTGGQVISCELEEDRAEETQANLSEAHLLTHVEMVVGDARELLRHQEESVDILLLDADLTQYETYFDVVYKRLPPGALIIADNAISHASDLSDYITYVQNHPYLESVTVPLGDGLEISVKAQ